MILVAATIGIMHDFPMARHTEESWFAFAVSVEASKNIVLAIIASLRNDATLSCGDNHARLNAHGMIIQSLLEQPSYTMLASEDL